MFTLFQITIFFMDLLFLWGYYSLIKPLKTFLFFEIK